jgi:hypothetical protein
MKKFITFLFLIMLASAISIDAMGMQNGHPNKNNHQNNRHNHNYDNRNGGSSNGIVGAPLDGGLLAVLGVASVAYVAARRKKKNIEV